MDNLYPIIKITGRRIENDLEYYQILWNDGASTWEYYHNHQDAMGAFHAFDMLMVRHGLHLEDCDYFTIDSESADLIDD